MSNILIITPYFWPAKSGGGGQVSIENLAELLSCEHSVSVMCYNHDFGLSQKLFPQIYQNYNKLKVFYFSIAVFYRILKLIRTVHYEYIYFNSFFSPICIFFHFYYAFSSSIKIVSPKGEFYEGAFSNKSLKKKWWVNIYKLLFKRTKFHATSHHEEPIIKSRFQNSKILIAADIPSLCPPIDIVKKYSNQFKIIYLSRIDPKKNLVFIPEILSRLNFEIVFDIWGDIGDHKYFEECMERFKNLPDNISWEYNGRLDFAESKQIFSNYNLFLFPTKGENYGHVIFESLSCGCPVLLTKDTTPWNDLEKNNVGYNIPLSDIQGWLDKITLFNFHTKDEQSLVSESCRNYIRSKCDIALIEVENLNLFRIEHVWK